MQVAEYLIHSANWSKHRISFELPAKLPRQRTVRRADMVCYDHDLNTRLLIECKERRVALGSATAEQIARYYRSISAPYWLITNGIDDRWFAAEGQHIAALPHPPEPFQQKSSPTRDADYWQRRGFLGQWGEFIMDLPALLNRWFVDNNEAPIRHLTFDNSPLGFDLSHYYVITASEQQPDTEWALTLLATEDRTTRICAIRNQKGRNTGLLDVPISASSAAGLPGIWIDHHGDQQLEPPPFIELMNECKNDSAPFTTFTNHIETTINRNS